VPSELTPQAPEREPVSLPLLARYAEVGCEVAAAVSAFAEDVRARRFPTEEHCYTIERAELERFLTSLEADG
jgi:hypothetical protein